MKTNIVILSLILLLTASLTYFWDNHEIKNTTYKDAPINNFTKLNGETITLDSIKQKPIIVHFWATWCAPCLKEIPDLAKMALKNIDSVTVLSVAVQDKPENIEKFIKSNNLSLPDNFLITLDDDWTIAKESYKTTRLPESHLISSDLKIIDRHNGALENWQKSPWVKKFKALSVHNIVDNK